MAEDFAVEPLLVFASILKDFKSDGDEYSGYVESADEYQEFINTIRWLGYSFAVRTSRLLEDKDSTRIIYSMAQGELKIPFLGSPFQVIKTYDMECSQGPTYKKKWTETSQYIKTHNPSRKTRRRQPTQRIGCPCKLAVKCIRIFTGYKIKKLKRGGTEQYMLMKVLKSDLKDPTKEVETQERYYVSLSKESLHTHPTVTDYTKHKKRGKKRSMEANAEEEEEQEDPTLDVVDFLDPGHFLEADEGTEMKLNQTEILHLARNVLGEKDEGMEVELNLQLPENILREDEGTTEAEPNQPQPARNVPREKDEGTEVELNQAESLRLAQNVLREKLHVLLDASHRVRDVRQIDRAVRALDRVIEDLTGGLDAAPKFRDRFILLEAQNTSPWSVAGCNIIHGQTQTQLPPYKTLTASENSAVRFDEVLNVWRRVSERKKDGARELNLKHRHGSMFVD